MRYFIKCTCRQFEEWKAAYKRSNMRRATYEDLFHEDNLDAKLLLKQSLISEQNGLCCYCCCSIDKTHSHIEHFNPRSNAAHLDMNYTNLHASCEGHHHARTCGRFKDNWFDPNLLVSPLDPNCETYFSYNARGKILPVPNDIRAATTIKKLNLDTPALNVAREAALWESGVFEYEGEQKEQLRDLVQCPDSNGNLLPFIDIVLYAIDNL